jgi:hypothetical protein
MTDDTFREFLRGLSDSELAAVHRAVKAVLQGSQGEVYRRAGVISEVIASRG